MKKPPPKAKPRDPLTKKASAAILVFVKYWGEKEGQYLDKLVKRTLQAERMKRENLYMFLESKGFRWYPRQKLWRLK